MTRDEFEDIGIKLAENFGKNYYVDIRDLLFRKFAGMNVQDWDTLVEHLIMCHVRAPKLAQMISACDVLGLHRTVVDVRKCEKCGGSGFYPTIFVRDIRSRMVYRQAPMCECNGYRRKQPAKCVTMAQEHGDRFEQISESEFHAECAVIGSEYMKANNIAPEKAVIDSEGATKTIGKLAQEEEVPF